MKILISSYCPLTHTSYGSITKEVWSRLVKTGEFDVAQHSWFNFNSLGVSVPWKLFPTTQGVRADGKFGLVEQDKYGEQSFEEVVKAVRPDIVWCLSDLYMSRYLDKYKKKYNFKLVRWTLSEGEPIDRDNIPHIMGADRTIGITNYATKKWSELTGEKYDTIYHGIDASVFKVTSDAEKSAIRSEISQGGISDSDFVMTYVGRNQARKRPWIPFEILHYLKTGAWGWTKDMRVHRLEWDPVARKHKEDKVIDRYAEPVQSKLWVHSHDDGTRWNFEKLENEWDVKGHVYYTQGLSDMAAIPLEDMAKLYQMSDALSMLSGSEGFGVPIIEAAACGIPCVYTQYSGHGEIGNACKGIGVPYTGWEPAPVAHVRWVYPDINQGIQAFYRLSQTGTTQQKREALSKLTTKIFDYDLIARQWYDVLANVYETENVVTYGTRL